jgi:predicted HTH domain antitoxin
MNILNFENDPQAVEELVYSIMVNLYQLGKQFTSLGEICEILGVDKSDIPVIYYDEYYELEDFYKENPKLGLEKINATIH